MKALWVKTADFLRGNIYVEPGEIVEIHLADDPPPAWDDYACVPRALGIVRSLYEPDFSWNNSELDEALGRKEGEMTSEGELYKWLMKSGRYRLTSYCELLESDYQAMSLGEFNRLLGENHTAEEKQASDGYGQELVAAGFVEVRAEPTFDLMFRHLSEGHLIVSSFEAGSHLAVVNALISADDGFYLQRMDGACEHSRDWPGGTLDLATRAIVAIEPIVK